jgi:esterase/lipase
MEFTGTPPQREQSKSDEKPILLLKRQVTIKSRVTDLFRQRAKDGMSTELKMIDNQMEQLEGQYQTSLKTLEEMAQQGHNVRKELDQLNRDAQARRAQLSTVKMEVTNQLANLNRLENGTYVVTGALENFVDVHIGDNIYDKLQDAEIFVEDGIITAIKG